MSLPTDLDNLWDLIAYVCRYARQPMDVVLALPEHRLIALYEATQRLIEREGGLSPFGGG